MLRLNNFDLCFQSGGVGAPVWSPKLVGALASEPPRKEGKPAILQPAGEAMVRFACIGLLAAPKEANNLLGNSSIMYI